MKGVVRTLRRDRRGVVCIELALLANLVLLPITLGAVDGGQLLMTRARLDQVLHQALFYAYANSGNVTAAGVQNAAVTGYGGGTAPTVNATIVKYCITPATGYPATGTPSQPSNNTCSGNQVVESYLSLTVSISVTLPFSVAWIGQTVALSVSGKARIA